jgi:hypothetical protein
MMQGYHIVHIKAEDHARLKREARSRGVTMGELVALLLDRVSSRNVVQRRANNDPKPKPPVVVEPWAEPPFWSKK